MISISPNDFCSRISFSFCQHFCHAWPATGGRKVVALILIVENFDNIQAIVMKLGDFS